MQNQIKLSQDRQSDIDRAKKAFFSQGGKVEVVKSNLKAAPIPLRKDPKLSAEEVRQHSLSKEIRELAPDMTREEIQKRLGLSYKVVSNLCLKFGIKPKNAAGKHPNSHKATRYSPDADRLVVERIKALAEIGVNKSKAIAQIGMGAERMNRLIDQYGIVFLVMKK